jgi:hypothetical protein
MSQIKGCGAAPSPPPFLFLDKTHFYFRAPRCVSVFGFYIFAFQRDYIHVFWLFTRDLANLLRIMLSALLVLSSSTTNYTTMTQWHDTYDWLSWHYDIYILILLYDILTHCGMTYWHLQLLNYSTYLIRIHIDNINVTNNNNYVN